MGKKIHINSLLIQLEYIYLGNKKYYIIQTIWNMLSKRHSMLKKSYIELLNIKIGIISILNTKVYIYIYIYIPSMVSAHKDSRASYKEINLEGSFL